MPARRRVTEPVLARDRTADAAPFEVFDRPRRVFEGAPPGLGGLLEHQTQGLAACALGGVTGLIGKAALFLGHGQADLRGQILDRVDEPQAEVLHQESDGVAARATAKAMVELLGRNDVEARGFFGVERAQTDEAGAGFTQRHVAADDVDDVDPGEQLVDEGLGNGHAAIFADSIPSQRRGEPDARLSLPKPPLRVAGRRRPASRRRAAA